MANLKASGAFKVVCDSYVTSDSGTGIVHQAPAFGEDDYRVGLANGIFKKGQEPQICPVDPSGKFLPVVTDFAGLYVKDADKEIIKKLKADGKFYTSENIVATCALHALWKANALHALLTRRTHQRKSALRAFISESALECVNVRRYLPHATFYIAEL